MAHPAQQPPAAPAPVPAAPAPVPPTLPAVGDTRCYWALLSLQLHFIYLDPVLAHHLGSEAPELVGKSLISFVHPQEQASAQRDLNSVLETRTLHGSVTTVRFSRLSRVRRELGYTGPLASWDAADKIAVDANYMTVNIVINFAAEGVVLCFLHATTDLDATNDNDEKKKTPWSNWCGTPVMSQEQIQLLFRRLLVCAPQKSDMNRVFQILSNEPGRPLLLSWPPSPPDQEQGLLEREFAKLGEDLQIGPGSSAGNEAATTSCTRRFKTLQTMHEDAWSVESVWIPHGVVTFAFHSVSPNTTTPDMQQIAHNYNAQTPYYEQHSPPYSLPPLSAPSASYTYLPQSASPATPYSPRWSQPSDQSSAPYNGQWTSSSNNNTSNVRTNSYQPQGQPWPPQPPYIDTGVGPTYQRHVSPLSYAYPTPGEEQSSEGVPASRRRVSPASARDGGGGRSSGTRPAGVLKCSSCKATSSPEWRKGPSGKKELCNACGLRYARSRAKKEGTQAQRKRKEKGIVVKRSDSPPSATSSSYPVIRRNYDDSSFSSAGSASGSDAYARLDDHRNSTPSPSPPTNFVHYAPGDGHGHYPPSGGGSFYSVPSPLSANPPTTQPYSGRASPMHSPATHSPLSTAAPSFERERDLLPPTPISATEPRRRSILSQQ